MKPHSGVNLDEGEWATLVEHFDKVKAVIHGEEVNLRGCKWSHDADEIVKVYIAEWFLNDELLNTDQSALPFTLVNVLLKMQKHIILKMVNIIHRKMEFLK